jgi:hypothetical protein
MAKNTGLAPGDLLQRLRETGTRLSTTLELPLAETPDASISLALSVSYERLEQAQQGVLQAAAIFESDFTAESVAYLLDLESESFAIEETLEQLVEVSLLLRAANHTYHMHPLVRSYALSLVRQRGDELENLRRRHARYLLRLVRKAKGGVR